MSTAGLPVETEGLGAPIKGPTALGSDPRRFWHLTRALAVTEFKLRFFGTALGYLWQLVRPLLLFGIIYAIFSTVARLSGGIAYYPSALLLAIVLFTFFSESTGGAVSSLLDRENLVRKIDFPRLAVPLATVLTALFNLVLNLVPVFIFLLAAGGRARWSWLEVPFLALALGAFATGLGMLLSAMFVRYRDVKPIWDVVLQAMFYATPIFYPITLVHGSVLGLVSLRGLLLANPLGAVIQQMRHALIDPSHPSLPHAMGGGAWVAVPVVIAVAVTVTGYRVFAREAPRVAERL